MRVNFYKHLANGQGYRLRWLLLLTLFIGWQQIVLAQTTTVTGTVLDDTGQTLPGVNILLKGTSQGTVTDVNGKYNIVINEGSENPVLVFNFIGFKIQEIAVNGQATIDVSLETDITQLQEVVVTGYGQTQNKRTVSSAINTISTKTIEDVSAGRYRPEQVLQGTSPGVTVQQNSGSPGAPLTIRVRGVSTAGAAQPLYLVDGMQVPNLNYLSALDIESISVLKDAAAAAIYGARGGNGVVLVKTKRGERNIRPKFDFEAYYGVQNLQQKPELMDKNEYIAYYNAFENSALGAGNVLSENDIAALPNTDWYDVMFDDNQPIQNYSGSLQGGGDNFSYYLSGNYFDQKGLVGGEADKSRFNRRNIRGYFDVDLLDNLKIKMGGDLVRTERNYLFENQAGTGVAIMNYISAIPSIYPAFDPDNPNIPFHMGDLNNPVIVNGVTLPAVGAVLNPTASLLVQDNQVVSDLRKFDLSGTWTPIDNLDVTLYYGYFEDVSFNKQFFQQFDFRPIQNLFNETGDLTEQIFESSINQLEGNVRYKFTNLDDHHLEVLGGFSIIESDFFTQTRSGSDFLVNTFDEVNFALITDATNILNPQPLATETGLRSFYARAVYDYKEKFLFSTTVRADASSRFSSDNRTGVFPSFSAGWVLSEEGFLANAGAVDLFKLRASWGVNGNDNIGDYQFSQVLNPNANPVFGGQNITGISRDFLANTNVKWEEVTQFNVGIDVNLFNNTLGLTLDYYDKKTTDMLVPVGTPVYTGLQSAAANVADVKNTGLEFLASYRKSYNSNFSWNAALNVGYNRNEVTNLGLNGQPIAGGNIGFIFADPITLTTVGEPIASFYGFEVESIDADGNLVFRDLDGEAGITDDDKTFIGSPLPDFTWGLTLGASFKGFDINAFFYGSQGNDIYDATVRLDASHSNRPSDYAAAGTPLNVLGIGATTGDPDQVRVSDFYVKDGSFTKLKFLTVGYSLPLPVIERLGLSKARFYITGQNLFVSTNYDGLDPEIGQAAELSSNVGTGASVLDLGIDRGFYPQPRTVLFGVQLGF